MWTGGVADQSAQDSKARLHPSRSTSRLLPNYNMSPNGIFGTMNCPIRQFLRCSLRNDHPLASPQACAEHIDQSCCCRKLAAIGTLFSAEAEYSREFPLEALLSNVDSHYAAEAKRKRDERDFHGCGKVESTWMICLQTKMERMLLVEGFPRLALPARLSAQVCNQAEIQ